MYADRFGSYSIAATFAGTPSLRRLKSTRRYRRLAPPPRWREVLRPFELRPPLLLSPSTRLFSGSLLVTSAKSGYVEKRRPGLVGLGLRIAIRGLLALEPLEALEDRDLVAGAHLDDGLLPRARAAGGQAAALRLGLDRRRADLDDAHVEELLDGLADLRLVRVRVNAERVPVVGGEHVALLAHDRADDDLARVHVRRPLRRRPRRPPSRPWRAPSATGAPPR